MKTFANQLAVTILLACVPIAFGQAPAAGVKHSYVRGTDTNGNLSIAFYDAELPAILTNGPYTAVDVVMQQCYGGGFMSYLASNPPAKDWTFSSAASPTDTAINLEKVALVGFGLAGYIDNYTRAWRDDAQISPPTGMKQHYQTTVSGNTNVNPAIPQDRFAPGAPATIYLYVDGSVYYIVTGTYQGVAGQFIWSHYNSGFGESGSAWVQVTPTGNNVKVGNKMVPTWVALKNAYAIEKNVPYPQYTSPPDTEHPQYASAGAKSDQRTLALPNPNTNNAQQYAILVQWDVPNRTQNGNSVYAYSYAANMQRIANALTGNYNVSTDNIVTLYFNGGYGTSSYLPSFQGLWPGFGGNLLDTFKSFGPISGPSGTNAAGQAVFADLAVPGKLFKKNGVPGTLPGTNAHVLVYFTGHGGTTTDAVKLRYKADPSLDYELLAADGINPDGTPDAPGFDAVTELNAAMASFLATTNDPYLTNDAGVLTYPNNVLDSFQGVSDLIQISTTTPIPSYVQLVINGYTNASLSPLLPVTPGSATLFDLDPLVPGLLTNNYTYQVLVDSTVLDENISDAAATDGVTQGAIDIGFSGLLPSDFNPHFVQAVIVRGTDQEVAYIPPDITLAGTLTSQDLGGGMLLTWPCAATNYYIQQNCDLNSTNWLTVTSPINLTPELTGLADSSLPMGTNWAYFSYTNRQMFFRLAPPQ